jgi:hypothetical protein
MPVVGMLGPPGPVPQFMDAFRRGLSEIGFVEAPMGDGRGR